MNERERIGKKIKEIRLKKGFSAYMLAKMTGMEAPNIYNIEAGRNSTGIDVLSRVASALGCRIEILEKDTVEDSNANQGGDC